MEVLADVTSHAGKRNSVSSESISGALSMISSDRHSDGRSLVGVVALSDDRASNVALAGSILSYKVRAVFFFVTLRSVPSNRTEHRQQI
jgi:hypothetical protein